ncbi:membrane protein [Deinococcus seoulensis]|uniref:Membrane protein n=1 Tax=Deinococcus seoulensis TaxID=1837379 RepID=A0ABQ2RSW1_9DEIO|nr:phage holin family protein [Deinococcus seoulensis]GGR63875.1 membrane protein [Deinococcus seoulensis]
MGFILRLLVNALALYLLARVYGGVSFEPGADLVYGGVSFEPGADLVSVLIAAVVMGIVNALIRPVLLLLSLPVNILTLGLFTLVVNGVVLYLVAAATALNVAGFGAAIIGAIILAVISWVLDAAAGALKLDGGRN